MARLRKGVRSPVEAAGNMIDLIEPIDLVEPDGLKNPYFMRHVNKTRKQLYVAP